ncbi:MAG TPA: DUF6519 domain-containing protein [Candidatus Didemnitutus sp.]|nr:DUF6519 domain-containing protein [Candidatus Didemnitutus sp.]
MKGDFTRNTFHAEKHHQQVLMQQGRVQLDADWNEQAKLSVRRDETTTDDLVGDCGGPADHAAFACFTDPARLSAADKAALKAFPAAAASVNLSTFALKLSRDFYLSPGRYYVDGIQCENDFAVPYSAQPDRRDVPALDAGARYLLYLDVWRRHITPLEDPSLREPALGGPDTATRVKTIWQVRTAKLAGGETIGCTNAVAAYDNTIGPSTVRLTARTTKVPQSDDPCQMPDTGGYKGLENQLYRVEVHDVGGSGEAESWKWSRENGSVVVPLTGISPSTKKLTVASLGQDQVLGFQKDQYVEILDDAIELEGQPGQIIKIADVDEANCTLLLAATPTVLATGGSASNGIDPSRHPKVRRWEKFDTIKTSKWLLLEAGIEVSFDYDGGTKRARPGDFWQIPARTATPEATEGGDIEWPRELDANGQPIHDNPLPILPRGVRHHYCRLGFVDLAGGAPAFTDCRCLWPALSNVPRLFYGGGDGQEVMPTTAAGPYKLPQPLVVGLGNGQCLENPAWVLFKVTIGNGQVGPFGAAASGNTVKIQVGADGMARCDFWLEGAHWTQQVTATLLDAQSQPVSLPIIFTANLSIASQVAYNPGDCAQLKDQHTVQDAIARLANVVRLQAVGGDGQDGAPDEVLPLSLRVSVASDCGPVREAEVVFKIRSSDGSLGATKAAAQTSTSGSISVGTDPKGVAQCWWKLGTKESVQEVEVELKKSSGDAVSEPIRLNFTANLRVEAPTDARVRIDDVLLLGANKSLPNDETITFALLAKGLRVICDGPIDPATVDDDRGDPRKPVERGQPTCILTLELPYPLFSQELQDLGAKEPVSHVGYRSVILRTSVSSTTVAAPKLRRAKQVPKPKVSDSDGAIDILLPEATARFVARVLELVQDDYFALYPRRLLLRLTLKGNFIWTKSNIRSAKLDSPFAYLDGEALRSPRSPTRLTLPSGDGRSGGDFEMWFWLGFK